jgi:uncharacterized protein YggE
MNRLSVTLVTSLALILPAGTVRPVRAQLFPPTEPLSGLTGNIEGFTVAGKGVVSARPNRFEIDVEVSAASELTADAIVKYRDARKRLQEAFAALKLDNVTLEERGLHVDQKGAMANPYFFDYQPNRKTKAEVQLSRKLVVKCNDVRKMEEEALLQLVAKLLDVAQDAGGRVGGSQNDGYPYYFYERFNRDNGLVRFILDDLDALEEEAYAKAVADAKARAGRLARLSGVKLGRVTAVREAVSPGAKEAGRADETGQPKRIESTLFQEIPVRVELLVRFDVTAPDAGGGRAGE